MSKIREINNRLKEWANEQKQEQLILRIILDDAPFLIAIQRRQFFESTDSEGQPLGEYSDIAYANKKGRVTIDLKLTGKFYDGIFMDVDGFPILFGSDDPKTGFLVSRFGKEIFGLRKEYLDQYIQTRFKAKYQDFYRSLFNV